jgi:hypothetical protein
MDSLSEMGLIKYTRKKIIQNEIRLWNFLADTFLLTFTEYLDVIATNPQKTAGRRIRI